MPFNRTKRMPPNGYTRRWGRGTYCTSPDSQARAGDLGLQIGDLIRFRSDVYRDPEQQRDLIWPSGCESVVTWTRPLFVAAPGTDAETYLPPSTPVDVVRRDVRACG